MTCESTFLTGYLKTYSEVSKLPRHCLTYEIVIESFLHALHRMHLFANV